MVYDLGGGSFDAAIMRLTVDGWKTAAPPTGIERLGGADFDSVIVDHVCRSLDIDLSALPDEPDTWIAMARLRDECRDAKVALSEDSSVTIPVVFGGVTDRVRLTRSEFEELIRPSVGRTIDTLANLVSAAGLTFQQIPAIVLAGGSSAVPLIGETISARFGRPVRRDLQPKHSTALGAALLLGTNQIGKSGSPPNPVGIDSAQSPNSGDIASVLDDPGSDPVTELETVTPPVPDQADEPDSERAETAPDDAFGDDTTEPGYATRLRPRLALLGVLAASVMLVAAVWAFGERADVEVAGTDQTTSTAVASGETTMPVSETTLDGESPVMLEKCPERSDTDLEYVIDIRRGIDLFGVVTSDAEHQHLLAAAAGVGLVAYDFVSVDPAVADPSVVGPLVALSPVLYGAIVEGRAMTAGTELCIEGAFIDDVSAQQLGASVDQLRAQGVTVHLITEEHPADHELHTEILERLLNNALAESQIPFVIGNAEMLPEADPILATLVELIARFDEYGDVVTIEGHTDSTGSRDANIELSRQRAMAIMHALIGRGVPAERLQAVGHGPDEPIASNDTPRVGRSIGAWCSTSASTTPMGTPSSTRATWVLRRPSRA